MKIDWLNNMQNVKRESSGNVLAGKTNISCSLLRTKQKIKHRKLALLYLPTSSSLPAPSCLPTTMLMDGASSGACSFLLTHHHAYERCSLWSLLFPAHPPPCLWTVLPLGPALSCSLTTMLMDGAPSGACSFLLTHHHAYGRCSLLISHHHADPRSTLCSML